MVDVDRRADAVAESRRRGRARARACSRTTGPPHTSDAAARSPAARRPPARTAAARQPSTTMPAPPRYPSIPSAARPRSAPGSPPQCGRFFDRPLVVLDRRSRPSCVAAGNNPPRMMPVTCTPPSAHHPRRRLEPDRCHWSRHGAIAVMPCRRHASATSRNPHCSRTVAILIESLVSSRS